MSRYKQFTGREELIKTIINNFFKKRQSTQVLSGMPGVGKTQLALEYAYKNALKYRLIWWINAESQATLLESCNIFLQHQGVVSSNYIAQEFCHFFERYDSQWLLIFDNAEFLTREQSQLLSSYIPKNQNMGHILITTRGNAQFHGISPIHVDVFMPEDAFSFIQKAVGKEKSDGAVDLAKRLGYLPLPLSYAVAYIDRPPACSCLEYIKLFSDKGVSLFNDSEDIQLDDYKWTVRETFMISIGKIAEQARKGDTFMKGVEQFIYSSAYLPAHSMDLRFMRTICTNFSPEVEQIIEDDALLDRLARVLTACSLYYVANSPAFDSVYGGPVLGMHRLLQEVIADQITIAYSDTSILSHLPIVSVDAGIKDMGADLPGIVSVHGTANSNESSLDIRKPLTYNMAFLYMKDDIIPRAVEEGALFKLTKIIFQESISLYYSAPCGMIPAANIAYTLQMMLYGHKIGKYGDYFNEENWLESGQTKEELNSYLDSQDTITNKVIHQYFFYWRIMVKFFVPLFGDIAGIKPFKNYSVDTAEHIIDIVTIMLIITDIPLYPNEEEFSQNWVYARIRATAARAGAEYLDELLSSIENFMDLSADASAAQKRAYYGVSLEDMKERVWRIHRIFESLICHTSDIVVDK